MSAKLVLPGCTLFCGLVAGLPSGAMANVPAFIENRGQVDERVLYYAQGPGATVYFLADGVVLAVREGADWEAPADAGTRMHEARTREHVVRVRFAPHFRPARMEGRDPLESRFNFFLGDDPTRWRTEVPTYGEIAYLDPRTGSEITFRIRAGDLAYRQRGGAGDVIREPFLAIEGTSLETAAQGAVRDLRAPAVSLVEEGVGPDGTAGRFLLAPDRNPSPRASAGTSGREEPRALLWSTFLGGTNLDQGTAVGLDAQGSVIVVGLTNSNDFPVTPGAYDQTDNGGQDLVVSKLSSGGENLIWCTFVGGASTDTPNDAVVDGSGNTIVAGETFSTNFPTTGGAYDPGFNGGVDGFVVKLSATGSALLFGSYLGGAADDRGTALSVDVSGDLVVAGRTNSSGFPTTPGAYDRTHNGSDDAFVAKLSQDGSALVWSTFLGGGGSEGARDLALDSSGNPVITGSASDGYPTTPGVYQMGYAGGGSDIVVSKLSSSGSSLLWSTYLGGFLASDIGTAIALDDLSNPILCGYTDSADFPTSPGAYDRILSGPTDYVVSALSSTGSTLLWSTYLGGSSTEEFPRLRLGEPGDVIVAGGRAQSSDFPVTEWAFQSSYGGGYDGTVTVLSGNGSHLRWSGYIGGMNAEILNGVLRDPEGNLVLTGGTSSPDFPATPDAYDTSYNGGMDQFVARLDVTQRFPARLFLTEYEYNNPKLRRMNPDGSSPSEMFSPPASEWLPVACAYDGATGKIYWTNGLTPGTIRRANLDGSASELLLSGLKNPRGLALDGVHGKLYWAEAPPEGNSQGLLKRANLDGTSVETIYTDTPYEPSGSAFGTPEVDPANGYVYFTAKNEIRRLRLDGTGSFQTVVRGVLSARSLALDAANDHIYFLDANTTSDFIGRANLDDTGFTVLHDNSPGVVASSGLMDLASDLGGGRLTWTDDIADAVRRMNLDATGVETIYTSPAGAAPAGISFDIDPPQTLADCNGNGVRDLDDIDGGTSEDCNANGIPDECEVDPCVPIAYLVDHGSDPTQRRTLSGDPVNGQELFQPFDLAGPATVTHLGLDGHTVSYHPAGFTATFFPDDGTGTRPNEALPIASVDFQWRFSSRTIVWVDLPIQASLPAGRSWVRLTPNHATYAAAACQGLSGLSGYSRRLSDGQINSSPPIALRLRGGVANDVGEDFPLAERISAPEPNPARGAVRLSVSFGRPTRIACSIHDLQGRAIRTLGERLLPPGAHEIVWDARNSAGGAVASGLYFVRLAFRDESGAAPRSLSRSVLVLR